MPVRAKADSRPHLEGYAIEIPDKLLTLLNPSIPLVVHTHCTHFFPFSLWASALYRCMVSALRSRVGCASARNNDERTNDRKYLLALNDELIRILRLKVKVAVCCQSRRWGVIV